MPYHLDNLDVVPYDMIFSALRINMQLRYQSKGRVQIQEMNFQISSTKLWPYFSRPQCVIV